MPASLRAHVSRVTPSRPYDRRSPTTSPVQSETPLVSHSALGPASSAPPTDADGDVEVEVPQDHPGLPTYVEYKRIEAHYLHSLSPRKRDKALITQAMFDKIWDVLHQPEACTIETPQFRFWVRKMFTLSRPALGDGDGVSRWGAGLELDPDADPDLDHARTADDLGYSAVVLHENRPVAIMEQLYELFCYCHVRAGHGGRDKTCAMIREHYSWVPKELTAQFVKACPTCVSKRNGHAHGAVGADVAVSTHRRGGGRARKGRAVVETEETPALVEPVGLGWPTTGGPLDPANPALCGVGAQERDPKDAGTVERLSPVSPVRTSRTQSAPLLESCLVNGWDCAPRALTLDTSPFRSCDSNRSLSQLFSLNKSATRASNRGEKEKEDENRSPTRTGLPSLASALSNGSLDDNMNLTELELGFGLRVDPVTGNAPDSECVLPPALRPLRLMGPVPASNSELDFAASPYAFQIDPVLFSFGHSGPGPAPSAESHGGMRLGLSGTIGGSPDGPHCRASIATGPLPSSPTRLCAPAMASIYLNLPVHSAPMPYVIRHSDGVLTGADTLPSESLSTECVWRRCGSWYGCRDGPRDMLYPYSADDVGQELDRVTPTPLSFTINE